eukprot:GGOE01008466.1.p1 GENE.GGOE01008466.1~~GGOE01008466.1.p1  ORF type:complete len:1020 (+),score=240.62 GGOE01008466.1:342-3062(+)
MEASGADLHDLVDGFGSFMQEVMKEFEDMTVGYASQLREEAASKVQSTFNGMVQQRILAIKRISKLYEARLIDVSTFHDQNLTSKDCSFLAMTCEASDELDYRAFIYTGLATGATISCNGSTAIVFTSNSNGTHLIYGALTWEAYSSDVPNWQRKSWWDRCMTEPPLSTPLSVCPLPLDCQCGSHAVCFPSYQLQVNASGPPEPRMSDLFFDSYFHLPLITVSYPIYNNSLEPRELVAVSGSTFYFHIMKEFLDALSGPFSMWTAVVLDDMNLSTVASSGGTSGNGANPNLPLAENRDLAFRTLATWMRNQTSLVGQTQVELDGIIWNVFPTSWLSDGVSYFVVVGMLLSEIYGNITSSREEALQQLQELQATHLTKLLASENRTRNHMKATNEANLQQLEAMKEQVYQRLADFRVTSEAALGTSEGEGRARREQMLLGQRQAVLDMLGLHLSVLTSTIGWSALVVFAVFLTTLLAGVYGTLSITKGLHLIIRLLEDVAHMRVESLAVPKDSCVSEVQRIQLALDKLVGRLALYKSFMPAGLFPDQQKQESTIVEHPQAIPTRRASHRDGGFSNPFGLSRQVVPIESPDAITPEQSVMSTTQTRIAKHNVVAMVLNVVSFQDILYSPTMMECQMKEILDHYVSLVHRLVAEARGNIDAIIGDQVLMTFNAHILCCDAPNVAARTALELQTLLAAKLDIHLQLQIGLAAGWTYIGCAGYAAFKAMVALGSPLKVASMLAHLTTASDAAVLADPTMEERLRYTYHLRPVALVCLPQLGKRIPALASNVPIFLLEGAKALQPNEWMYEISPGAPLDDWAQVFRQLQAADGQAAASDLLEGYLSKHPADIHAQQLKKSMRMWRPKAGVPLCERPDSHHSIPGLTSPQAQSHRIPFHEPPGDFLLQTKPRD